MVWKMLRNISLTFADEKYAICSISKNDKTQQLIHFDQIREQETEHLKTIFSVANTDTGTM